MKAGVAGGVETVVKIINTHIGNAIVCCHGCGALWIMTVKNGKDTDKRKQKKKRKETNS